MTEMPTRDGYGKALERLGKDRNIVAMDGDLSDSTRSQRFQKLYPDRFFNMGISEADMVSTAAGLASCGKIPFVSSFACFLIGRAYDQILISVAYSNMNVKLVGSHSGIATGEDGPTAQAITDIACMRAMPNMRVVVPADAVEAEKATEAIAYSRGPAYLRVSRPKTEVVFDNSYEFELGKAVVLREGADVSIIAAGIVLPEVLKAAQLLAAGGISAGVINMHTIKPIDKAAIVRAAKNAGSIVTVEDHSVTGGLGAAVSEVLAEEYPAKLRRIGLAGFAESAPFKDLYERYGLSAGGIAKSVTSFVR